MLTDLAEARPLIRAELNLETPNGGHVISGLVVEFVSEDFMRRFSLTTRKSLTETHVRISDGQCVTSSAVGDITFELARHEFQRTIYVLRDLRDVDMVLGLPWLDDEHASLQFRMTRAFTLMDGIALETQIEEERLECLLMSSCKTRKLVRKTRRGRGRNAEFYVIDITPTTEQPSELYKGEELTAEQHENFRSLLYDDFLELLRHMDSPHVSRQWDHPIDTIGPMKRQRHNRLSPAERAEFNRQLKDPMEAGLIRPSHSEFSSPILFLPKANNGSLRLCIDYRGLNEVTRKDAYILPRVYATLDELKDASSYTHLDLASSLWQVRVHDQDIHKTAFRTQKNVLEDNWVPRDLDKAADDMLNLDTNDWMLNPRHFAVLDSR
jgi:hypothetical protein